ncbi:MAG: DUF4278 domain-containing protein [Xenococcus sp. (in: cyanobacteria)]
MKLRFLGQTYSATDNQIRTAATEHTAKFLGQTYIPHRPIQPFNSKLGLRKYRGIAYGG